MAQWNTNVKHEPSSINNGNRYEIKDRPTREQLNALAENSFYAVNKSEEAIEKANSAFEANGTLVTINGENQTTWSADFVEDERQKTLNLCSLKSGSHSNKGVTIVYNAETQTITLNGTATSDADIMYNSRNILPNISNMSGQKIIPSFYIVSGSFSGRFRSFLGTYDTSNIWSDRYELAVWDNGALTNSYEFTVGNNYTYDTLMFYCHNGATFNNLVLKVQFTYEPQQQWYYPYGYIVHKNEINNIAYISDVAKREISYDYYAAVDITSSKLTTLQEYVDLFNLDSSKTYKCDIGNLESSNFKNLVGNPSGFANYTGCYIKQIVKGSEYGERGIHQLIATNKFGKQIAIGYLKIDNLSDGVKFTGWSITGG